MWRVLMLAALVSGQVMHARACPTAYFAYFDFGHPSSIKYAGPEDVHYFVGSVVVFYHNNWPEPKALIRVLKDYSGGQTDHLIPRLPDIASMKVAPAGQCRSYVLAEGDVGVFAYYEKEGVLWLAWQSGGF